MTEKRESHDVLFLYEEQEIRNSLLEAGLTVEGSQTFRKSSKEQIDLLIALEGRKL